MKIDIVHVDKDDPLYKVIVIDDFFDDFENIKKIVLIIFTKIIILKMMHFLDMKQIYEKF